MKAAVYCNLATEIFPVACDLLRRKKKGRRKFCRPLCTVLNIIVLQDKIFTDSEKYISCKLLH